MRIIRDRLQIQVSFGPVDHPEILFDHEIVGRFLGLGTEVDFDAVDEAASIHTVGSFINAFRSNLTDMFASNNYSRVRRELEMLQEARADHLFGPLP